MASKYDLISKPFEVIGLVQREGLSMGQEDLCRVQDIFGRAPVEELVELANDIGRNDEHGNPDPKGSWSSNRKPTRDTFYMVLTHIWNWEDVARFWNQHTNPEHEEVQTLREQCKGLKSNQNGLLKDIRTEHDRALKAEQANADLRATLILKDAEIHDRDMQIMELKAKLYDLMMKEDA